MRGLKPLAVVVAAAALAILAAYAFTPREVGFNTQQLLTTAEQECRNLGGGWTYRRATSGGATVVELAVPTTGANGQPLSDRDLAERHALRVANGWTDQDLHILRTEAITTDGSGPIEEDVNEVIELSMSDDERLRRLAELRAELDVMPPC